MAFRETLGIEVESKSDGEARLRFPVKNEHLNDAGTVHGGALATLADCAMGSALMSVLDDAIPVTVEMKINFLEPAKEGTIVAIGKVRRQGKRFTVLEAELYQEETEEHVAYATATFTLVG